MSFEVSDARVEYRPPRPNGLGGGWWVSCSFAGRQWRVQFYGRDPAPDAALETLTEEERSQLVAGMLTALEKVQRKRIRRKNSERQFKSGMRSLPSRPLVVPARPVRQTPRNRSVRRSGSHRARAPTSSEDDGDDEVSPLRANARFAGLSFLGDEVTAQVRRLQEGRP
jgi:hypothetical protein